jgi:hypothetical protein
VTSQALTALLGGADEVRAMRTHYPVPQRGFPTGDKALAAKAHGRACVVLLSSHLDRYVYAVNEEAVDWLNSRACPMVNFPEPFLLQYSKNAVDELADRSWEKRGPHLRVFVASHGPVWSPGGVAGSLVAGPLLAWMKSPAPDSLVRFYRLYGVPNIFDSITRKPATRGALYLGLTELVEKRNNIAHGDFETQALPADVTRYLTAVRTFGQSADRVLSRVLRRIAGGAVAPW